ncbi:MAG: hypothetical protein C4576_13840 [Desulfobacteraceae bacterium]|nr:MAG: hypothetical protein C4576_13840 [Desulfobacteraceae bacterium]
MEEKKKDSARKFRDFKEHAVAVCSPEGRSLPLTMDGTAVVEISLARNTGFARELMDKANRAFNPRELKRLEKEPNKFLKKAEDQVKELWSCMESMIFHSNIFTVSILIAIGLILNEVEANIDKDSKRRKSKYMKWLKDGFGHEHLRYFQQARQLANMGEFARKYACLGKNRLLEFERLKTDGFNSYQEIFDEHPFVDVTTDMNGELFKEHVDSIITYRRFIDEEFSLITFEDAELIASYTHHSLEVKEVKKAVSWLTKQSDQKTALEDLLLNRLVPPYSEEDEDDEDTSKGKRPSLNKLLADVYAYETEVLETGGTWYDQQKDQLREEVVVGAYGVILELARKLNISLDGNPNTEEQKEG